MAMILVAGVIGLLTDLSTIPVALLAAALGLAIISFIDDLRSISALARFGCHALGAVGVLAALGWPRLQLGLTPGGMIALSLPLSLAVSFLWMVGYTNAFNFMDGINGIAAGQAVVTGLGMALLGGLTLGSFESTPVVLSLVVSGAALGFLPHNFPTARMFMGDVGSAPLGFLLAGLVLWFAKTAGWWLIIPLALLHANFALDTGATLLRRICRGQRWHEAHREHFYQRLVRAGKSHAFVMLAEMALQVVVLGLLLLYLHLGPVGRTAVIAAIIALWTAFYLWAEMCFRRSGANRAQPVAAVLCHIRNRDEQIELGQ